MDLFVLCFRVDWREYLTLVCFLLPVVLFLQYVITVLTAGPTDSAADPEHSDDDGVAVPHHGD